MGLAAAYAGVSASFAVNVLITPLDSLLTEVTNEAIALVDPDESLGITANLYFAVASTFFTALVVTFVTQRMIERPRRVPPQPVDQSATAERWQRAERARTAAPKPRPRA